LFCLLGIVVWGGFWERSGAGPDAREKSQTDPHPENKKDQAAPESTPWGAYKRGGGAGSRKEPEKGGATHTVK